MLQGLLCRPDRSEVDAADVDRARLNLIKLVCRGAREYPVEFISLDNSMSDLRRGKLGAYLPAQRRFTYAGGSGNQQQLHATSASSFDHKHIAAVTRGLLNFGTHGPWNYVRSLNAVSEPY